jgi:hypothetical protein
MIVLFSTSHKHTLLTAIPIPNLFFLLKLHYIKVPTEDLNLEGTFNFQMNLLIFE